MPAFIPLLFKPGEAYQFNLSHEDVEIAGKPMRVKVAHMRLCASRAVYVRAYPRETQEMVFDAHARGFAFFGGVPLRGIYDNMKTAVTTVFVGKERVFNRRFLVMADHYMVEPTACSPAAGWEKGLFAGSDRGGQRAAFMFSLIATAKLNDIDPQAWLADVLARIADIPQNRLHELLPWNWQGTEPQREAA